MATTVAPKAEGSVHTQSDDPVLTEALTDFETAGADLGSPMEPSAADDVPVEPTGDSVEAPPATEPVEPIAPDAPAQPSTPDEVVPAVTAPATPDADPLAGTAPLDYTVGTEARAFDGILVDKTNGGAFILPDKLEAVRARLAEADAVSTQMAPLTARIREYDDLSYTTGPKGQEKAYKGLEAFQQLTADAEANAAAGLFLLKTLQEAFPGPENALALKNVFTQADFEHRKAAFEGRQRFVQNLTDRRAQTINQTTTAQQEGQWMTGALTAIQKALPALTPADVEAGKQFFAKRPQLVYRSANATDAARLGVRLGERIADPEAMNEWFTERAALRAQQVKETQALTTATSAASRHNAGMQKGRQPARHAARSSQPSSAVPVPTERTSRGQKWTDPLSSALTEMGITD